MQCIFKVFFVTSVNFSSVIQARSQVFSLGGGGGGAFGERSEPTRPKQRAERASCGRGLGAQPPAEPLGGG